MKTRRSIFKTIAGLFAAPLAVKAEEKPKTLKCRNFYPGHTHNNACIFNRPGTLCITAEIQRAEAAKREALEELIRAIREIEKVNPRIVDWVNWEAVEKIAKGVCRE